MGMVSAGTHPHPPRGLGWRGGGRVCHGSMFLPLFSAFNFIMRALFLKSRWGKTSAGLNAVAPLPPLLAG